MPVDKMIDDELTMLEKKDIDIRNTMSLIHTNMIMHHSQDSSKEMRVSCSLKTIIDATKMLQTCAM